MSINDYEFFNGVVLNKLIRKGKPVKIDIFPSSSNNAFTINDKIGLYIKYSKKLVSPWRFGFQREHQDEFKIMSDLCKMSFLILVCNKDGIVCINNKTLKTILDDKYEDREIIVFCKKNSQNLLRLIKRTDHIKNKIIIDDEADYASPNSKINRIGEKGDVEKTKINERIYDLIGKDGIYIGVTATPARLDLNNTFENENHRWVYFKPHAAYKGQDFSFL